MLLRHPSGQRLRAFVAVDAPPVDDRPALRWFARPAHWTFNPTPAVGPHDAWYRFKAPPGVRAFRITLRGRLTGAWFGAIGADPGAARLLAEGKAEYIIPHPPETPPPATSHWITIRVRAAADSFGADTLPEPIRFHFGPGVASLGDWCALGLAAYSGAAWYRRSLTLTTQEASRPLWLDLGEVRVAAEIWLNHHRVGTRIAAPWSVCLAGRTRPGENRLAIKVFNTLANHYSVGIPTPYHDPSQTPSGLFGPVQLREGGESEHGRPE
jgi:hypothetical protein